MKKIFLIFILLIPAISFPEERNVNLDECINIALQNHPDIFLSIEDNKKSAADYRIAKSQRSIIVNGQLQTIQTDKESTATNSKVKIPGKDTDIGLFAGITISYNLYDAKKEYVEESAKTGLDISKLKNQETKNNIILEVKNSYYGYLLSKNILIIREEINKKYKKKSDLAKQLFEQGSRPILDVSKAEVDVADSQLQLEKARNDERKTKLSLFHSMGLEETESLSINPKDIDTLPEIKCSLDELYKMAEVYSPQIRIITLQKRTARLQVSQCDALHYPTVDLSLGFGYSEEKIYGTAQASENLNFKNWTPTFYGLIVAALPIYTGGRISASVDSAVTDFNKITYKEKELIIETKNKIRDSFKSIEEIKKQIEISHLITKNAQRHLLLAQRSYENGGGSQLELQDAELSVINADIGFLEAKYGYLLTLAKLSGIIGVGENALCKDQD